MEEIIKTPTLAHCDTQNVEDSASSSKLIVLDAARAIVLEGDYKVRADTIRSIRTAIHVTQKEWNITYWSPLFGFDLDGDHTKVLEACKFTSSIIGSAFSGDLNQMLNYCSRIKHNIYELKMHIEKASSNKEDPIYLINGSILSLASDNSDSYLEYLQGKYSKEINCIISNTFEVLNDLLYYSKYYMYIDRYCDSIFPSDAFSSNLLTFAPNVIEMKLTKIENGKQNEIDIDMLDSITYCYDKSIAHFKDSEEHLDAMVFEQLLNIKYPLIMLKDVHPSRGCKFTGDNFTLSPSSINRCYPKDPPVEFTK